MWNLGRIIPSSFGSIDCATALSWRELWGVQSKSDPKRLFGTSTIMHLLTKARFGSIFVVGYRLVTLSILYVLERVPHTVTPVGENHILTSKSEIF